MDNEELLLKQTRFFVFVEKNYKALIGNAGFWVLRFQLGNIYEAEDVFQQAFLNGLKNLDSYDPTLSSYKTWFDAIQRNVASHFFNYLKVRGYYKHRSTAEKMSVALDLIPGKEDSEKDLSNNEIRSAAERAIKKLNPRLVPVARSYFLEDKSLKQITEDLQIPRGTTGTRLFRAIEILKKDEELAELATD